MQYFERAQLCQHPVSRKLFQIMAEKKSNLAVSADFNRQAELIQLIENVGEHICVLKTHIDILEDFDTELPYRLKELAEKYQFIIFEDRKFADIGNTVKQQYQNGIYQIASWAKITNAHILPGEGIISGLKEVGLPLGNGLLLLAEMSSQGNFFTQEYTDNCIHLAKKHADFVIGFIAQKKLIDDPRFIHMTPGVNLAKSADKLGQQYHSPEYIIGECQSDIIIVGRGIIEAENQTAAAKIYQQAGWQAYEKSFE